MQPPIILYTLSTCRVTKARKVRDKLTAPYDCTDVDLRETEEQNAILEKIKAANPRAAFPTVIIGDPIIVRFQEREISKAFGRRRRSKSSMRCFRSRRTQGRFFNKDKEIVFAF